MIPVNLCPYIGNGGRVKAVPGNRNAGRMPGGGGEANGEKSDHESFMDTLSFLLSCM